MIRSILIIVFLFLFFLVSIFLLPAEWLLHKWNPRLCDISSLRIVQWALKVITWISGARVTYIGKERIPRDQAVLYVGNHNSYFDIIITYSQCPGLTGYIAKVEFLKIPLLSHWMKRLYCLFLDRSDIKAGLKTILTGIEYIKQGISICIFPEGTRSKDGKMLPFKEGSMKMASKTGCLIVPVAITGTADLWERHLPYVRPAKVIVEYGAPIDPKALTKEEQKFLGAYVQKRIQEMLDRHSIN